MNIREDINKIKKWGTSLNENKYQNLDIKNLNKIYNKLKNDKFKWDFNVLKNDLMFNIYHQSMSLWDEEVLYNTNDEYKKLLDKDENKTITVNEKKRMHEIFILENKKIQSKAILYHYNKKIKEKENKDFTDWVEKTFLNQI